MQSRYESQQHRQKSGTNVVMRALVISWIVILAGVWRVFFGNSDSGDTPTNLIGAENGTGDTDAAEKRRYIGEKIFVAGEITKEQDMGAYTHTLLSDQGDSFGLKSKDVDLFAFEDGSMVQLKGAIDTFKKDIPVISVTEIVTDTSVVNPEDVDAIEGNSAYHLFRNKGLGIDLSITEGYNLSENAEGAIVLTDTVDNTDLLTIKSFRCTPGDSLKDCTALKKRFDDIGSETFVSSNGITFYNLTETITRAAFHPNGEFGYYFSPKDEKSLTNFTNIISFVDEDTFLTAINAKLSTVCKNIDVVLEEASADEVRFNYEEKGLVEAIVTQERDGYDAVCRMFIRLGNSLQIIPVSFSTEGEGKAEEDQEPQEVSEDEDDTSSDSDEVSPSEDTPDDTTALPSMDIDVATVPENRSGSGRYRYQSVRGYDVYFGSTNISYAGEILEDKKELAPGVTCVYQINVTTRPNADNVATSPDTVVYECTGPVVDTDTLKTIGQVDDSIFVRERRTDTLGTTPIVVTAQEAGEETSTEE